MSDPRRLNRSETEALCESNLSLPELVEAVQDLTHDSAHRAATGNHLANAAPSRG